ncbi:hypothetical protein O9G_002336 [Rozella allomycis CSF55]|uniref:Coiled-coil domain-containing protein 13 n=1 Tax=Rozella allomycis (strain CSF55) TaxID=988480 RepID=A0A075B2B3_ROZAC|nr:hypothetical protein O9G_002336 [Rozella allomycis CSF55]|eukprot:EPZ36725.1 hypothetical protein O9G_002336 [Rozella allomycis CSF55]
MLNDKDLLFNPDDLGLIHELQEENRFLKNALEQNENKNELKESKIIELSKRARRLNVSLEKERTLNDSLRKEIEHLKNSIRDITEAKESNKEHNQAEIEVKSLKEKIQILQRKLEEERIQVRGLKQENMNLKKIVAQEVGIEEVTNGVPPVGWKGRQQIISLLKNKIKTLQIKLKESGLHSENGSRPDSVAHSSMEFQPAPQPEVNSKVKNLEETVKALHLEAEKSKKKAEQFQCRAYNLEKEVRKLKEHICVLIQKSEDDDLLIQLMERKMESVNSNAPVASSRTDENKYQELCAQQYEKIRTLEDKLERVELKN